MAESRNSLSLPNQDGVRWLPASVRNRLTGRDDLHEILGNIGWQAGDSLLRMGVGFLLGIWVARYLGPEQFGLFSYALSLAALLAPLAMLGLDDIVVRNLVRDPAAKPAILGTCFLIRLAGGVVATAATIGLVLVLRPEDRECFHLVAIIAAGTLFQAFSTIELWFNAQLQARYPVLAKGGAFLACALGKAALILAGAPLVAFAWIALAEVLLGAGGLVVVYRIRSHRFGEWIGRLTMAGRLLRDSWPLIISCVVIAVYLRIDQVMLGEMAGSEAVGVYSVAVRLAEVWLFLSAAIYWSVLPGLVKARAADEALFFARLQKYYNLMALSAYLIAVPVMLFADRLVAFLFGAAYAGAGPMLAVLIWANLFLYLESARSAFFNVMNWYRIQCVIVVLGAGLNIGLNLWLIPHYGGLGAAAASCIAYWFVAHGSCFLYRPLRRTGWMLTRAMLYPKVW